MKYILALFFLWLCNLSSVAQFIVTNDGFVDSLNPEKRYVVIQTDEETKEESIKRITDNLRSNFCGIDDEMAVDGNVISIKGKKLAAIDDSGLGITARGFYHILYRIEITVKDGRVKTEILECQLAPREIFKETDLEKELGNRKNLSEYRLYNDKGKPRKKATIMSLKKFADNLCDIISKKAQVEDEW